MILYIFFGFANRTHPVVFSFFFDFTNIFLLKIPKCFKQLFRIGTLLTLSAKCHQRFCPIRNLYTCSKYIRCTVYKLQNIAASRFFYLIDFFQQVNGCFIRQLSTHHLCSICNFPDIFLQQFFALKRHIVFLMLQ